MTTAEHPFFVEDKGWLTAQKLTLDHQLYTLTDEYIEIEAITWLPVGQYDTYNFAVDEYSTYGVGKFGVWTHNSKVCDLLGDAVNKAVKNNASKIDPNKVSHIFGQSKHNLDSLVKTFGSPEKAFRALQDATQATVREQGIKGVFETAVKVGGETVTVRGNIVDDVVKLGTAFK